MNSIVATKNSKVLRRDILRRSALRQAARAVAAARLRQRPEPMSLRLGDDPCFFVQVRQSWRHRSTAEELNAEMLMCLGSSMVEQMAVTSTMFGKRLRLLDPKGNDPDVDYAKTLYPEWRALTGSEKCFGELQVWSFREVLQHDGIDMITKLRDRLLALKDPYLDAEAVDIIMLPLRLRRPSAWI